MSKRRVTKGDTPLLEWIVGALGAVIFAAILAVLISNGLGGDAPPSVVARVERIVPVEGGYAVEISARNAGDTTAADVEIKAESGSETRTARFDYLPPHSERRGGVFFEHDPRGGELQLRAEGWQAP